jgi:phosphoribosylformylglycinamidine cyclo-ligase
MSLYSKRGVSAQKEEVHKATEKLDKGLYPNAFCKIYPDYLGADKDWVNLMHADGAGTKSILAYLYWRETGDVNVWKGIAEDAIVMNLDDLLCVGIYDNILFSSTIDRNKRLIPGEVLEVIINHSQEFFEKLRDFGVNIHFLGGETADVGDVVRTIAVNGTMSCRWPKNQLITNDAISPGDVIVGFASYGQSTYEDKYNSGIASNGLTSARHDTLSKHYAINFAESYDGGMADEVAYIGSHRLTDSVSYDGNQYRIADLLLSPTRTFAPVVKNLLENHFSKIHGLIHASGGGQTKCLKYLPGAMRLIKDNLFSVPPIFRVIASASGADQREMFQVFNMGQRLEVYCAANDADDVIATAKQFNVEARVIGRVEESTSKELLIQHANEEIAFAG